MPSITFRVDGEPNPQPRPKAFARRMGQTFAARVYDPGTAEGWKSLIAAAALPHRLASPIGAPVALSLEFVLPRPKSLSLRKYPGRVPHTGRYDADNLAKAVMDALTQLGLWVDDGQVYRLAVAKFVAGPGERPGCDVRIRWRDAAVGPLLEQPQGELLEA